jgi:peptidoglycan/LPS O-acetylase OafA/YrhL
MATTPTPVPEFQPQTVLRDSMTVAKPEEHISFLDHLRGIAIILVFLFHSVGASYGKDQLSWNGWLRDFHISRTFLLLLPLTLGWGGVAMFFVVSGFCIHLSHERSKAKEFKVFFARRFFRIYPPYFVTLIFFALIFPSTKLRFHSLQDFEPLVSHLFLIHNLDLRSYSAINGSYWSIAVEAQLYLLYPILLFLVQRLGWKNALWLTGSIEMTMRTISGWHDTMPVWFNVSPFIFWFSWSIGAILANDFLKGQALFLRGCPLWLWPSVTVICYFIKPLSVYCFVTVALFTANLIAYLLSTPNLPAPSRGSFAYVYLWKHVRWVGIISYSVYLIHQPFLWLVPRFIGELFPGRHIHPLITFAGCLLEWPVVLFLSYWLYQFVERPSASLGKWFVRTKLVGNRQ